MPIVMILEMFSETGGVKEANLLAERTKSESIIVSLVLVIGNPPIDNFNGSTDTIPRNTHLNKPLGRYPH